MSFVKFFAFGLLLALLSSGCCAHDSVVVVAPAPPRSGTQQISFTTFATPAGQRVLDQKWAHSQSVIGAELSAAASALRFLILQEKSCTAPDAAGATKVWLWLVGESSPAVDTLACTARYEAEQSAILGRFVDELQELIPVDQRSAQHNDIVVRAFVTLNL